MGHFPVISHVQYWFNPVYACYVALVLPLSPFHYPPPQEITFEFSLGEEDITKKKTVSDAILNELNDKSKHIMRG